jgi:alkylhydroperoxidase family enzyme
MVPRALVERIARAQERRLGGSMDYLRRLGAASGAAFLKFGLFAPVAQHRRALAPAPWHLARVAATHTADCGPCVQVTVSAARLDGVAPATLRAALDGDLDALPPDEALAVRFGRAVATGAPDLADATEAVADRFGEAGRTEMALAVATALVFPHLKRGLGLAVACELGGITIPGETDAAPSP